MTATSMRTHRAGDLRLDHAGETVAVCGWIANQRDHGGVLFLDVRDTAGLVQVVVDTDRLPDGGLVGGGDPHAIRNEWVVRVQGDVRPRPEGTANSELATGDVEVAAATIEVLSAAEPPPIPIDARHDADESLRYRYRYLDLRGERLQRNLRLRATVNAAFRRVMDARGFVEVETPMLIASTPEGARDFVVPSRLQPGAFYALPQSPQLFKQLLMVGGLDRYYQIARCLRDEDPRADRQFEFMQLDVEMTFGNGDDVMVIITDALLSAAEDVTGVRPADPERITWHDAMAGYGVDKPDLRFSMQLTDVSEAFAATEFRAFQTADAVLGMCVSGEGTMTRAALDRLTDRAKQLGAAGLVWMKAGEAGTLESPVAKFLSESEQLAVIDALGAEPGDLLLLVAGERAMAQRVLGALRLDLGRPPVTEGGLRFVWVVDFPLFEGLDDGGRPIPAHHPFTMPHPDDLELLMQGSGEELLAVRSLSYDLVLNGWELGSGSVRIHDSEIQQRIFAILGISPEDAQARFGFLLEAFRYGAPPHAGFAVGVDRTAAILAGEENIREVTAFPKTQSGADPLTGAPSGIDPAQLEELGLRVLPRKPK